MNQSPEKSQILEKGGKYQEHHDTIESWLNFLTRPENLRPGLPELTVDCLNPYGTIDTPQIRVSFSETAASIKTFSLEVDRVDEVALPVFQLADSVSVDTKSSELYDASKNPHRLREWIFNIFKHTELSSLNIKFRNAELPDLFDRLPKLQSINLFRAHVKRLPPSFFRLPALVSLDISESKITEVPDELAQIKSLERLTFTQPCPPTVLGRLPRLTHLNCKCSRFSVPEDITQLIELKQLHISDVAAAPDNFLNFPKLEYLYFHSWGNPPAINFTNAKVPFLKKLNTNHPAAFATVITSFKNLEQFTIGDGMDGVYEPIAKPDVDQLTESLKQISGLTKLNLQGVGITDLGFCLAHPKLEYIYMHNNKIAHVPAGLAELPKLKRLDLSKNLIEHVPDNFHKLYNAGVLTIKDNPVVHSQQFKDGVKQSIVLSGGSHDTVESLDDWLTFLTNPLHLKPGLPELEVNLDWDYYNDGLIEASFSQEKASLKSLKLVIPLMDESQDMFRDEPTGNPSETNPHYLKKWIFDLFQHTELEELDVEFRVPELPDLFHQITKLRVTNFNQSMLKSLPPSFYQLPGLETLTIQGVPLAELPAELSNLPTLKHLTFSQPGPHVIWSKLTALEELTCSRKMNETELMTLMNALEHLANLKSCRLRI